MSPRRSDPRQYDLVDLIAEVYAASVSHAVQSGTRVTDEDMRLHAQFAIRAGLVFLDEFFPEGAEATGE